MTFGAIVVAALRDYLKKKGKLSLGALTAEEVEAVIDTQFAIHFPQPKKSPRVNGRDLLFDAIAIACEVDLASLTRNYAKQIATAKRDILEATPDCTPLEIETRGKAYRAKYSGAALTPMALASRWPELGTNGKKAPRKGDVYSEPEGWRERILKLNFDRDLLLAESKLPWLDVRLTLREILVR